MSLELDFFGFTWFGFIQLFQNCLSANLGHPVSIILDMLLVPLSFHFLSPCLLSPSMLSHPPSFCHSPTNLSSLPLSSCPWSWFLAFSSFLLPQSSESHLAVSPPTPLPLFTVLPSTLSADSSFPPSFCFSPVSPFCPPSLHLPPPLCLLFTYRRHLESPNRQSQVKVIHQASPVLVGETGVQRPRSGLPENQSGLGRVCLTVQTTPPAPGTPFLPWDSYTMSPVSYKPPLSFQLLAGRGAWNVWILTLPSSAHLLTLSQCREVRWAGK